MGVYATVVLSGAWVVGLVTVRPAERVGGRSDEDRDSRGDES